MIRCAACAARLLEGCSIWGAALGGGRGRSSDSCARGPHTRGGPCARRGAMDRLHRNNAPSPARARVVLGCGARGRKRPATHRAPHPAPAPQIKLHQHPRHGLHQHSQAKATSHWLRLGTWGEVRQSRAPLPRAQVPGTGIVQRCHTLGDERRGGATDDACARDARAHHHQHIASLRSREFGHGGGGPGSAGPLPKCPTGATDLSPWPCDLKPSPSNPRDRH